MDIATVISLKSTTSPYALFIVLVCITKHLSISSSSSNSTPLHSSCQLIPAGSIISREHCIWCITCQFARGLLFLIVLEIAPESSHNECINKITGTVVCFIKTAPLTALTLALKAFRHKSFQSKGDFWIQNTKCLYAVFMDFNASLWCNFSICHNFISLNDQTRLEHLPCLKTHLCLLLKWKSGLLWTFAHSKKKSGSLKTWQIHIKGQRFQTTKMVPQGHSAISGEFLSVCHGPFSSDYIFFHFFNNDN